MFAAALSAALVPSLRVPATVGPARARLTAVRCSEEPSNPPESPESPPSAVSVESSPTSPLVGKPLREVNLPDGILVGAIVRSGEVIIPDGTTEIMAGDRVVLFARFDQVKKVEQMFRVSLEFF